jgi:hypothetical protein
MIQTVITFYLGPVHSVKNLRKVRVECTGGEGGRRQHRYSICTIWTEKSLRTIGSKMRQKTKSVHRARGSL